MTCSASSVYRRRHRPGARGATQRTFARGPGGARSRRPTTPSRPRRSKTPPVGRPRGRRRRRVEAEPPPTSRRGSPVGYGVLGVHDDHRRLGPDRDERSGRVVRHQPLDLDVGVARPAADEPAGPSLAASPNLAGVRRRMGNTGCVSRGITVRRVDRRRVARLQHLRRQLLLRRAVRLRRRPVRRSVRPLRRLRRGGKRVHARDRGAPRRDLGRRVADRDGHQPPTARRRTTIIGTFIIQALAG